MNQADDKIDFNEEVSLLLSQKPWKNINNYQESILNKCKKIFKNRND